MKIGIISGSTRHEKPQSTKVAGYIQHIIQKSGFADYWLNLSQTQIKYWDETFWSDYANFDKNWHMASTELHECDGLVIVSPEWNGMIPPALLNIFHLAVKGEFANKPALLVGVSASINGVYPIAQLRINSGKNTFINYIPQHVIVRNAEAVLNDFDLAADENDRLIRERLEYSLKILAVYTQAFIQIRNSDIIKNTPFQFGM